jgi:hypothetical protein
MRIVTWNCRRGPLAPKRAAVDVLDADVTVLAEAPRPTVVDRNLLWFGASKSGIAVTARPPFQLSPLPQATV